MRPPTRCVFLYLRSQLEGANAPEIATLTAKLVAKLAVTPPLTSSEVSGNEEMRSETTAEPLHGSNSCIISPGTPSLHVRVSTDASSAAKAEMQSRLSSLVKAAPVMLFLKGSANEPRCKFSRQMVDILNEEAIQFGTFDILQDEDVRQALKRYSNWPTYPQLYVRGELMGGVDIVKEMRASGHSLKVELLGGDGDESASAPTVSLEGRLRGLIGQANVVLFMKGSPDAPKCNFSAKIVGILKDQLISYAHFDILSDEDIRQGLKKYSLWPTYPQL